MNGSIPNHHRSKSGSVQRSVVRTVDHSLSLGLRITDGVLSTVVWSTLRLKNGCLNLLNKKQSRALYQPPTSWPTSWTDGENDDTLDDDEAIFRMLYPDRESLPITFTEYLEHAIGYEVNKHTRGSALMEMLRLTNEPLYEEAKDTFLDPTEDDRVIEEFLNWAEWRWDRWE